MTFLEEDFQNQMKNRVMPFIRLNLEEGSIKAHDGERLHYGCLIKPDSKAAIVISHGFCEFIPKYYEFMYIMYEAGYSVYMLEHRGHGYSGGKVKDEGMVSIDSFFTYIEDFHVFVEEVVKSKEKQNPLYLYAHSMGGGIAAMYMEKYPADFKKAVLSSPMIEMQYGGIPYPVVKIIMGAARIFRWKNKYMPGQKPYDSTYDFENSCGMSESRYRFIYDCRKDDAHYRSSGAAYSWGMASMEATKYIKENVGRVCIPVLLCQAGMDNLVSNAAQDYFVENTQNTHKILYADSKHEIYNALQKTRDKYYQDILDFLG